MLSSYRQDGLSLCHCVLQPFRQSPRIPTATGVRRDLSVVNSSRTRGEGVDSSSEGIRQSIRFGFEFLVYDFLLPGVT